jgi:nicotinamidase-related amidase
MRKILLVIDVQNDFVDGALGSPGALEAAKKIINLVADERWAEVIATVDHHHPKPKRRTLEAEMIPPHCIAYSPGAALYKGIAEHVDYIIEKDRFSIDCCVDLWPHLTAQGDNNDDDIEFFICGLCTDICVISNALTLRSAFPRDKITVIADACAGTSTDRHAAALEVMKSCLIDVKTSDMI